MENQQNYQPAGLQNNHPGMQRPPLKNMSHHPSGMNSPHLNGNRSSDTPPLQPFPQGGYPQNHPPPVTGMMPNVMNGPPGGMRQHGPDMINRHPGPPPMGGAQTLSGPPRVTGPSQGGPGQMTGPPRMGGPPPPGIGHITSQHGVPPGQVRPPGPPLPPGGNIQAGIPPRPGYGPPGAGVPPPFGAPGTRPSMNAPPPTSIGPPPNRMQHPPATRGTPPPRGMPPTSIGTPPGGVEMPPTSIGVSPRGLTNLGPPPVMPPMGMPPNSIGIPPSSMTMPPNSVAMSPNSMRMPPSSMGMSPSSMAMPPTSMGMPPSSTGMPPSSTAMPPNSMTMPPNSMAMPPNSMATSQPMRMGAPPTNIGAPPMRMAMPPGAHPPMAGPPRGPPMAGPPRPGPPPKITQSAPLDNLTDPQQPSELPIPYHGQASYTHSIRPLSDSPRGMTPNTSEPQSQKSSRAPSPISNQQIDAIEGQFTPRPGQSTLVEPPTGQDISPRAAPQGQLGQSQSSGIVGRRVYPPMQPMPMPSQQGMPPPPPGAQTGPASGILNNVFNAAPGQGPYQQQPGVPPSPRSFNQPTHGQPMPGIATGYPLQSSQQQPGYGQIPPQPGAPPGDYYGQGQGSPRGPPNNIPQNYNLNSSFGGMAIQDTNRPINLLQEKNLIPEYGVETPVPEIEYDFKKANCNPDIFRCTMNNIPQSQSLLNKARLPLGILMHPFKDLSQLPVIQSSVIVRCRSCRTYINPFVYFVDQRRWKCNVCYRVNDLPEEFLFDPVTKTYGEPHRRPEIRSATIEFIAPSEYMLRPPQPAVYLYLLDVSFNAIETGYLQIFCQTLIDELDRIPGDARTLVGFITFDRALHFYNLSEGLSQPQMMIVPDLEEVFLPVNDGLLTNLRESRELIIDLLNQLPTMFADNMETGSALGPALQIALKLMTATGGRVTVMQTVLPSAGPGALKAREDPNLRAGQNVSNMGPATDFYKKIALDCSAQQIAVDLFLMNSQYADIASIGGASKHSGGSINYYSQFHSVKNPAEAERFENDFRRYLTRKIGFESVMRVRCTKGLAIHTFHGNFFVRSTDLLSLPNVNPDSGFAMQVSIEENLTDNSTASFQCALLYTSSKGERRIRVHTLCLPVTNQISDVFTGADQQAIVCLLSKMAVDRSLSSSLTDAREAMINACIDSLGAFGASLPASQRMGTLPTPHSLRLLPLYVAAMLKSTAFRIGTSTRLDDRVHAMEQCKTLPLAYLIQKFYPDLYPVHALTEDGAINRDDIVIPQPKFLQLSAANIDRHGVYLLDVADCLYLYIGGATSDHFCQNVLAKPTFAAIPDGMSDLPELPNPTSELLRNFIGYLLEQRPFHAKLVIIRDDGRLRMEFMRHMVEDRTDSSTSYYEFLQHIQKQIKG